jgi:hypothetical protein
MKAYQIKQLAHPSKIHSSVSPLADFQRPDDERSLSCTLTEQID